MHVEFRVFIFMNRLFFLALATALLMLSCGGKQTAGVSNDAPVDSVDSLRGNGGETDSLEQLITETPMPRAADELFDDFLFNFAANRELQQERIAFPLRVIRNGDTIRVEKNQWKHEHFFMRQDFYTVIFDNERQMGLVKDTSVNQAVVEKIYFNTKAVMRYYFRRIKGAWMLVEKKTEGFANNRNASFLSFYRQFVTDTTFQVASINETVDFIGPDPDDDFSRMEGILTPDTWLAFAPALPDRMIYNIIYGKPTRPADKKIFVMRGIANGLEVEMTFRCMDGHWKLMKLTT